jgi:hypothetical protein
MGIGLWIGCGFVAVAVARIIPLLRPAQWLSDAWPAVVAAALAGLTATALDFGGWNEPDWRTGVFAFVSALAAVAWVRATLGLARRNRADRGIGDRPARA